MTPEDFAKDAKSSPFHLQAYSADIGLDEFLRGLFFFLNRPLSRLFGNGEIGSAELISAFPESVPAFQRNNDKWTEEMQSSFVSNILQGYQGNPLMLYVVGEDVSKTHCQVLDGLQRITALIRFFSDPDMSIKAASSDQFISAGELLASERFQRHLMGLTTKIKVYNFTSELEAVEHYIHINRNITHSEDDIKRAFGYREKLLSSNQQGAL